MAGSKSDYLENKLLDHVLGNTAYSAPGTVYVALYTVAPTDSGGGTEVTGGNYSRVAVTNSGTNWETASGGLKQNKTAFTFPTASADWGTVLAMGILDAASGGNLLYWATITSKIIYNGDTASFAIHDISVNED